MPNVLGLVSQPPLAEGISVRIPRRAKTPKTPSVRWIDSVEDLEAIKHQWSELAKHAIWQNPWLEPNVLIAAFKHLGNGNVRVLVVEDGNKSTVTGRPQLLGLVPLVSRKFYHLPIPCLEVWNHENCCDSTPLIANARAVEALRCMFSFLSRQKIGLLSLDTFSAEPAFQSLLEQVIREEKFSLFHRDAFSRAAVRPCSHPEEYFRQFASKNVKKNHGRLIRRLSELGEISYELSDDFSDYQQLAQQFLDLEASGWKVKTGTALACNPSTRNFYEELIFRSAQVGKARFLSLKLDGKPIAMLSDIQSGGIVYCFKTAFDESFSAFSPGLLVEMKNIEYLHQTGIAIADSCTAPDNANINRIFGQRLRFQSVVIGLRPGASQLATRLMPWIQAAANRLKRFRS